MKQSVAALITFSFLFLLAIEVAASPTVTRTAAPDIVTKFQWGSMKEGEFYQDQPFDPYSQGPLGGAVAITVHHTSLPLGTNPPNSEEDVKKVQSIQRYHVSKRWGDVGYHFLIGSDGSIYQGRPIEYTGTHAPPNSHNVGVSVIGDFQTKEYPSETQLAALMRLTTWLCDRFDIDPTATITLFEQSNPAVCGHRDWGSTDCPGDRLYVLLPNVRERIRAGLLAESPAYDGRISVVQFLPETLLAGQQYQLPFAVRNTGYVTWSYLNQIALESSVPDVLSVAEPVLKDGEAIAPLSNRSWEIAINTPSEAGTQRPALQMAESERRFGPELAWDARILAADDFISQWLVAGPFPADSPEAAFAKDFFAGEPLDMLDIMDEASESAHGYSVTGEYRSGERTYRGEDGERVKESGRYYRGEESFRLSLANYKGGDVVLRRRISAGVRDQVAYAYVNGQRVAFWRSPGARRYGWKDVDLVIPAHYLRGRDSMDVRLKAVRTKQWGCTSFRYTLLDSAESLVSPRAGDKVGELAWRSWKSHAGVVDLSSVLPGVESGAVYLAAYVRSPSTRWVEIRTGYNGYLKAWLNGKQALAGRATVLDFPDTVRGEVLLEKGWNRLLVKIVLQTGLEDLYVRLCGRDGPPLKGLKLSFEPADPANPEWLACR